MSEDLSDEQKLDIEEQWKFLIQGLNTFINSSSDDLVKQNENLIYYIENWLTLGRQLLDQSKEIHSDKILLLSQLKVS
jgi:hypothetical protein